MDYLLDKNLNHKIQTTKAPCLLVTVSRQPVVLASVVVSP
jgi:hypothetical protein